MELTPLECTIEKRGSPQILKGKMAQLNQLNQEESQSSKSDCLETAVASIAAKMCVQ